MRTAQRSCLLAALTVIVALVGIVGPPAAAESVPPPDGATVTYAATEIIPPPPAPSFSSPAGGDGWTLAFHGDNLYTVFHHALRFTIACRDVFTAAACDGYNKTITNPADSSNYSTGQFTEMYIDQSDGHLYSYVVQLSDMTAGVLEIDLTSSDANPFVSFTPLSGVGEALKAEDSLSTPVLLGTKWYAFNFKPGAYSGTQNTMMCFDVATHAACPGQPWAMPDLPTTPGMGYGTQPPATTQLGTKLLIPFKSNTTLWTYDGSIYCFDTATNGSCGGSWPVTPPSASPDITAAPVGIPALDADGVQIGVCFASFDSSYTDSILPNIWCYDGTGAFMAPQSAAIGAVVNGSASNPFNGPPVVLGTRVYIPQGNDWGGAPGPDPWVSVLSCFDWSTGAQCPNFPTVWTGYSQVSQIYTVIATPGNPSCIWSLAHTGSAQIRNFDAYTNGPCGQGGTRILMSSFVEPAPSCRPTKYLSMTISSPSPADYSGGTVTFQDSNGDPITAIPPQPIVDGVVDLSPLNLSTTAALPQMLVDLPGAQTDAITMRISWEGAYHDECVLNGQSVEYTPPDPDPVPDDTPVAPAFTG